MIRNQHCGHTVVSVAVAELTEVRGKEEVAPVTAGEEAQKWLTKNLKKLEYGSFVNEPAVASRNKLILF